MQQGAQQKVRTRAMRDFSGCGMLVSYIPLAAVINEL